MCTHRIKIGDSEQWHYISQQCRDRVSGRGGKGEERRRGGERGMGRGRGSGEGKRGSGEGREGERERGGRRNGEEKGTGMSGCRHI